ncbi:GDP-mannose mannosyl hydrolase [Caminibacter profundus]
MPNEHSSYPLFHTPYLFLPLDTFKCVVENTPLISIDFLIKKNNKYLLGKRVNSPAKGYYFTIGGRIFKNETIEDAQKRILKEELNLSLTTYPLPLKFIGIFEHFYEDSIFGDDISTHYINLAYLLDFDIISKKHNSPYPLSLNPNNIPFEQHNEYIWLSIEEIMLRNDVHQYIKDYFKGSEYV